MNTPLPSFDFCYPSLQEATREATARSYAYDMPEEKVHCYRNAYLLPAKYLNGSNAVGGCVDAQHSFIWDSAVPDFMGYPYDFDTRAVESEPLCIYIGYMFNCYGHVLGDCLRWAWFAQTEECRELLRRGAKFVCISIEPLQPYQTELLWLAGVETIQRMERVTKIKYLYIPTPSLFTEKEQNYYSQRFNMTIDCMIRNAHKECSKVFYDKIYLTRSRWKRNDTFGERQIERFFAHQGYCIVSPERMSIAEQIVMLNSASSVAATECSLSHQMIFCRPQTECYILRKNLHINRYSLFINQMRALKATYIDCSLSLLVAEDRWWDGPFFLYVNDNLLRCFTHTHTHTHTQGGCLSDCSADTLCMHSFLYQISHIA